MDAASNTAAAVFVPSAGAAGTALGSGSSMAGYTLRSLFILLLYYADLGTDIALLVDLAAAALPLAGPHGQRLPSPPAASTQPVERRPGAARRGGHAQPAQLPSTITSANSSLHHECGL